MRLLLTRFSERMGVVAQGEMAAGIAELLDQGCCRPAGGTDFDIVKQLGRATGALIEEVMSEFGQWSKIAGAWLMSLATPEAEDWRFSTKQRQHLVQSFASSYSRNSPNILFTRFLIALQ